MSPELTLDKIIASLAPERIESLMTVGAASNDILENVKHAIHHLEQQNAGFLRRESDRAFVMAACKRWPADLRALVAWEAGNAQPGGLKSAKLSAAEADLDTLVKAIKYTDLTRQYDGSILDLVSRVRELGNAEQTVKRLTIERQDAIDDGELKQHNLRNEIEGLKKDKAKLQKTLDDERARSEKWKKRHGEALLEQEKKSSASLADAYSTLLSAYADDASATKETILEKIRGLRDHIRKTHAAKEETKTFQAARDTWTKVSDGKQTPHTPEESASIEKRLRDMIEREKGSPGIEALKKALEMDDAKKAEVILPPAPPPKPPGVLAALGAVESDLAEKKAAAVKAAVAMGLAPAKTAGDLERETSLAELYERQKKGKA